MSLFDVRLVIFSSRLDPHLRAAQSEELPARFGMVYALLVCLDFTDRTAIIPELASIEEEFAMQPSGRAAMLFNSHGRKGASIENGRPRLAGLRYVNDSTPRHKAQEGWARVCLCLTVR